MANVKGFLDFIYSHFIVIMLIFLLLLLVFYLGLRNVREREGGCFFEQPFVCMEYGFENNGGLRLQLGQMSKGSVVISSVGCYTKVPRFVPIKPVVIQAGSYSYVVGGNSGNTVFCIGDGGSILGISELEKGFSGNVCVRYTESWSGVERVACGTMEARL